jgi:hypothetical protein
VDEVKHSRILSVQHCLMHVVANSSCNVNTVLCSQILKAVRNRSCAGIQPNITLHL